MNLHSVNAILAQASNTPVLTTNAPPQTQMQDSPQVVFVKQMTLPILVILFVYFLFIRPQSKKAKEQAAMLKTVKPGDKVITSSGIVGTVVAVKDRTISLRSAETKLEVLKSAITDITKSDGEAEAS